MMRRALPSWAITVLSVAALLAAWAGATNGGLVGGLFLPSPADLLLGFEELLADAEQAHAEVL